MDGPGRSAGDMFGAVATEKTVRELEFNQILDQIAGRASSRLGAGHVRGLRPSSDRVLIEREFGILEESRTLLIETTISFGSDLDETFLKMVAKPGAILPREQLVGLMRTYETVKLARRLSTTRGFGVSYPRMLEAIESLPFHEELESKLRRVFSDDGVIRDTASDVLGELRSIQKSLRQRIENSLHRILRDDNKRKLLAEDFFTLINDRYVILLKTDHKGQIKGIIQGESASGLSLYLEPISIVEMNNELIEAKVEEAREIRRILRELSEKARVHQDDYPDLLDRMGWLDSIVARARWSTEVGANVPELTDDLIYQLRTARHPLLGEKAIPIDMDLDPGTRVIVISGVNSGGKTVGVKLAGLSSLMAQSGIPVPAAASSRIPIFDTIDSEIGDQQSIADNLSSFSSHISHVSDILSRRRGRCLMVFDEFMAGTDPDEGAALAESILLDLSEGENLTFVTTHYGRLKLLSQKYEGFVNMAVEFDWDKLAPTFHLIAGRPGSSLGIEIARRFGIESLLADRAQGFLDSGQQAMTRLVRDLERELARLREKRQEHEALSRETASSVTRLEGDLKRVQEDSEERILALQLEHLEELEELKAQAHRAVNEKPDPRLPGKIHEAIQVREKKAEASRAPPPLRGPLLEGTWVSLPGTKQPGMIVEISRDGKKARVLVNGMQVSASTRNLSLADPPREKRAPARSTWTMAVGPNMVEVNLISLRVVEALEKLEDHLERAYSKDVKEVRVIHGRGTGALRNAVREYLGSCRIVKSHRHASPEEGDSGVTMVTLR